MASVLQGRHVILPEEATGIFDIFGCQEKYFDKWKK